MLKKLRQEHKLSQEALAKQLNVTQVLISAWENGVSRPSYECLVRLAKIFDVDIADLVLSFLEE